MWAFLTARVFRCVLCGYREIGRDLRSGYTIRFALYSCSVIARTNRDLARWPETRKFSRVCQPRIPQTHRPDLDVIRNVCIVIVDVERENPRSRNPRSRNPIGGTVSLCAAYQSALARYRLSFKTPHLSSLRRIFCQRARPCPGICSGILSAITRNSDVCFVHC